MKIDKMKKIFAGVGMGLMLTGGAVLSTGCTDMNLTQDQVDKILEVVDNSDTFMNETMDLLQESNKKIDNQTAVKMYELAVARLELNKDDIWSNLKVKLNTQKEEENAYDQVVELRVFKKDNGYRVFATFIDEDGDNECETLQYIKDYEEIINQEPTKPGTMTETQTFSYFMNGQMAGILNVTTITEEDIVNCEVLDNGNYRILAVGYGDIGEGLNGEDLGEQKIITECEITNDGYLVSKTYFYTEHNSTAQKDITTVVTSITIEYNSLTADDFVEEE